ncbi:acetyltransferase, partial [Pseudomonas amygdali pv. mori str. 301020]
MNITITEVHPSEIPHTVDFVMRARAGIFPLLDTVTVPPDLAGFEQVYLDGEDGKFLIARSEGQIIAAVG